MISEIFHSVRGANSLIVDITRQEGRTTPYTEQTQTIRRFFNKGQPLAYPKNEVILGNDPVPNGVYYISSGYIKVYSISDSGDEYLHVIYGKGELFPLVWAFLGVQPQHLFYETISESSLWRISSDVLASYVSKDVVLSNALGFQLARQFRVFADRLDNLEYKKASERIAYHILFLASRFGIKVRNTIVVDAPISHELFANSINLARESVSREIEKLEQANILEKTGRQSIVIKDVDALASRLSHPISFASWHLV